VRHDLTADQEFFASTTRRFLEAESPVSRLRELHDKNSGLDAGVWRQGAALGWTAPLVPPAMGGGSLSGSGLRDLALIAEELGRVLCPVPLLPVNVVLDTLVRVGSVDQCDATVAELLAGESVATWAFSEGRGIWDPARLEFRANKDGDGWVLNGTKTFVQEAASADVFLVSTRAPEGPTQFLIPASLPGVEVRPRESLDLVRSYGDIDFTDVRVEAAGLVGELGTAGPDIEHQFEVALVLQNAETVGALDTVFDFTLQYASERVAFGRPLSSYQALKHRFADMKMWLEACHATATASTDAVADGDARSAELVSIAKSYIAARAPQMLQDCVQLHGGIGVTWEHDLHLFLRRVTQNAALYGGVRFHRERIAALISAVGDGRA
jgi:alkylation response protein AidB-like acyl-CoA dehydrogenase